MWLVGHPSGALPHLRLRVVGMGLMTIPHPQPADVQPVQWEKIERDSGFVLQRYSNYLIKGLLSLPLLASQQPSLLIRAALEAHTSVFKDILKSF